MNKPNSKLLRMYAVNFVKSINVKTDFISEDNWRNYLILKNEKGNKVKITDDEFNEHYKITTLNNGVARLRDEYERQCKEYYAWLEENEADRIEYERLKDKFEC